nr:Gag-Pol polyprotein [Tanacetum cinerariifolium]
MGKSKKESHLLKPEQSTNEKLQMLHMDLCGPMRVETINGKRYILVIVDDYSLFTWNDWDLPSQSMLLEYFKPLSVVSTTISTVTLPSPDTAGASSSTTINKDAPSTSTSPNNETTTFQINSTNVKKPNNKEDAVFDSDTFTNPFAPLETSSADSSRRIVDTLKMHTFQQP